jgi:peptidoglycan/xylan/chitin deacetylase (PgdA/CDA1 family)
MSKREHLANLLNRSGLLRLAESIGFRPVLLVLAYHRIGTDAEHLFDDELISATAQDFRAQLAWLREHFTVIGLEELLHVVAKGFVIRRPTALVTFDDGYRDNHDVALPILHALGVPAVFFIATGYIGVSRLTWWDRTAYIVKTTQCERLELDYPVPQSYDLSCTSRVRAIELILRAYREAPEIDDQRFFGELENRASVHVDSEVDGRDLFMSWDQIRALRDGGMGIGAHTHNHPILARLSEAEQNSELMMSRDRLRSELGTSVEALAYPVGDRRAFSTLTKRLAYELGYRVGFSYYGGANRTGKVNPYDIRRVAVERYHSIPMFRTRAILFSLIGDSI